MKEQIEQRVRELQRKIDTDAEYTRPEHRTAGEQTLALYYIALGVDAIVSEMKDHHTMTEIVMRRLAEKEEPRQ